MDFKDALDQPIEIGKKYGYSASQGSTITVVIGEVLRFTEKKVTLKVISRRYFMYGEPTEQGWHGDKPVVSIHPVHLFPVQA